MTANSRKDFETWAAEQGLPLERLSNDTRYESMETEWAYRGAMADLGSPSDQDNVPAAAGSLRVMGNLDLIADGETTRYDKALLITFDSADEVRTAVSAGTCQYIFTG